MEHINSGDAPDWKHLNQVMQCNAKFIKTSLVYRLTGKRRYFEIVAANNWNNLFFFIDIGDWYKI